MLYISLEIDNYDLLECPLFCDTQANKPKLQCYVVSNTMYLNFSLSPIIYLSIPRKRKIVPKMNGRNNQPSAKVTFTQILRKDILYKGLSMFIDITVFGIQYWVLLSKFRIGMYLVGRTFSDCKQKCIVTYEYWRMSHEKLPASNDVSVTEL